MSRPSFPSLRSRRRTLGEEPILQPTKLRAIDAVFQRQNVTSFADLGAVWAVDAGYAFYALETYEPARAFLVDEEFTPTVKSRAAEFPGLNLLPGNFGDRDVPGQLGHVDVVLLFDVLLHQVQPDWDEILRMYATVADCLILVNPQYVGGRTERLIDLGRERYDKLVPAQPGYEDLFDRLDEYLPERGRAYRDIHNVWQWGIVDADIKRVMSDLGFELTYFENAGQWRSQLEFENHAFAFVRSSESR